MLWSPTTTTTTTTTTMLRRPVRSFRPEVQAFFHLPLEEGLVEAMDAEVVRLQESMRAPSLFQRGNNGMLLREHHIKYLWLLDLKQAVRYARAELRRRHLVEVERRLAFAMVHHSRLGAQAPAAVLPWDVMHSITMIGV